MSENVAHAVDATSLADLLERVLDKGVVIAGDIRIKLADIELLTINIRLLLTSVEKAREIGLDWWENNPFLSQKMAEREVWQRLKAREREIADLQDRLALLEQDPRARP